MNRRFGSVHVNEIQGNPWQPDVSFRGYTASPLLGTPQGLSVYVDGIRFNQPFGDIVSWDLLPTAAIASIALMPGSNPLFGLNTLGGALSVQTKDGATHPGTAAQVTAGGHGRAQVEVESGGKDERGLSWFGVATAFRDNGWRDDSGSRLGAGVRQARLALGCDAHLALTVERRVDDAARQRTAGRTAARGTLRERLHAAGRDAQSLRTRQHRGDARARRRLERLGPGLPAPHRHAHRQRRPERRRARPAAVRPQRSRPRRPRRRRDRRAAGRRRHDDAVSVSPLRRPGAAGRRHRARLQRRAPPQPQPAIAGRRLGAGDAQGGARFDHPSARRRRCLRCQPDPLRAVVAGRLPSRPIAASRR